MAETTVHISLTEVPQFLRLVQLLEEIEALALLARAEITDDLAGDIEDLVAVCRQDLLDMTRQGW